MKPSPLSLTDIQAVTAAVVAALEAVRGRGAGPAQIPNSPPLVDLCNEYLVAKAQARRSDGHLHHIRKAMQPFVRGRESRPSSSVTAREIEIWIRDQGWSARTMRGYLMDLRALFAFAMRRGYVGLNPALGVDLPEVEPAPPGIHTPDQVRRVLEAARRVDANTCRCLAIRYFAGLRSREAQLLAESEIQLGRGFIEVTAAKAKTRARRLAEIVEPLPAWLELGGRLPLGNPNDKFAAVVRAAGVEWPHNVTRHTWASYHLAQFGSAARTAIQAGHTETVLFRHYRELVTPEAAREFWSIRPENLGPRMP